MRKSVLFAVLGAVIAATSALAANQNNFIIFSGAATDTTAIGMADSSIFYPTANYQRLYLVLKPNKACRVAIMVKTSGDTLGATGAVADNDTTKAAVWDFRGSVAPADTSMSYGETVRPTSVVPDSRELVVTFDTGDAAAGVIWEGPRARYLPIRDSQGTWYWGERTQIRLRVLGGSSTPIKWNATLKGVGW